MVRRSSSAAVSVRIFFGQSGSASALRRHELPASSSLTSGYGSAHASLPTLPTEPAPIARAQLNLDVRGLDHRRPAGDLAIDARPELGRRIADRLHQLRRKLVADRCRPDRFYHLALNSRNDGLRRARRARSCPSRRRLRRRFRPLSASESAGKYADRFAVETARILTLPAADMRRHRDRRQAAHLHVAANDRGHRRGRGRVGHVHHLGAALERDRLHGEVRQRAVPDRSEVEFARFALEQRNQFADAVNLNVRIDRQRARLGDELGDRGDVGGWDRRAASRTAAC